MKKVLLLVLVCLSLEGFTQTSLTSLSPNRFLTHASPTMKKVTIYGKQLWPDHMTNAMSLELVKVYFRKGSKTAVVQQLSGNKTQLTVSFNSADWLTTPGNIEVYLSIGSLDFSSWTNTNILTITVDEMPPFPPVITDVSPKEFKLGLKREDYMINILGNHFGEVNTTSVTIGGILSNYGRLDLDNGKMLYWIPKELIGTAGTYDVVVKTAKGTSNAFPITIGATSTKVAQIKAPIATGPKLNTVSISKPITANVIKTDESVRLIAGARVIISGMIASEMDRVTIVSHIQSLDNVVIVKDETNLGANNANLLITVVGERIDRAKLDVVKAGIENKLRAMGVTPNVVVK